jgi:hypothetical protein
MVVSAPPAAASTTRRYRIDQPDEPHAAARQRHSHFEPATISGSVFRLYTALAPHLSLVGAVTLVVCGSVLYWIAISRNGADMDPRRLLEFDNGWSHEMSTPQPQPPGEESKAAAMPMPLSPALKAPAINWTAPPRVANATAAAAESEAAASPVEESPDAAAPASTTKQPTLPSAEAAPPVVTAPQAPPAMDQLAAEPPMASAPIVQVTPTPQVEPYPTTPYPAFSFADPAFLAERPDSAPGAGETPR